MQWLLNEKNIPGKTQKLACMSADLLSENRNKSENDTIMQNNLTRLRMEKNMKT
jgi:hypothetical protein